MGDITGTDSGSTESEFIDLLKGINSDAFTDSSGDRKNLFAPSSTKVEEFLRDIETFDLQKSHKLFSVFKTSKFDGNILFSRLTENNCVNSHLAVDRISAILIGAFSANNCTFLRVT